MKLLTTIIFLFLFFTTTAQPYRQQKTSYKIEVQLNDADHTLDGFLTLDYFNQSPDTLTYIWLHLWPNAFKNDQTAYSDQLLENGKLDFYFSDNSEKGYINRLDFRVNEVAVQTEDHPEHIDIVKLRLPNSLLPGSSIRITTPFHVQLPYNFSGSGHRGKTYQITQWYPKPAVYDERGWHPMPFLEQGGAYGEFGDYEVAITLPEKYKVVTSGILEEKVGNNKPSQRLVFRQNNIHDFVWFASSSWLEERDSLMLPDGRWLQLQLSYTPEPKKSIKKTMEDIKEAVLVRSNLLGTYGYNHLSVVAIPFFNESVKSYPCVLTIPSVGSAKEWKQYINRGVGYQWFSGMVANNQREYAWMSEGLNAYYEKKLMQPVKPPKTIFPLLNWDEIVLQTYERTGLDQPVNLPAPEFSSANYHLSTSHKAAQLFDRIADRVGRNSFDSTIKAYCNRHQYRHAYPEDLWNTLSKTASISLDTLIGYFDQKGALPRKYNRQFAFRLFPGNPYKVRNPVYILPLAGYNQYDGVMLGGLLTNYNLPLARFQWMAAPLYGRESGELNFAGRLSYTFYPATIFSRVQVSLSTMRFSQNDFTDTAGKRFINGYHNWVPAVKWMFRETNPRSTREKFILWKTYFLQQDRFRFRSDTFPNGNRFLKVEQPRLSQVLHQLQFVVANHRALYPYRAVAMAESMREFTRLTFTGNYFFNYNAKEGLQIRLFAGKFIYNQGRNRMRAFQTLPYHLNMTGPRGNEDYTYSNYFIGRNEFEGWPSRQIMMRDGGFKLRTDLLANKIGKTDDWLMALNFVSDIPENYNILKVLPVRIPLKVFLDIGTSAPAWQTGYTGSKMLYNAGFQLSLANNLIQIYVPLLYSKVYREYVNSIYTDNKWLNTISFSIDIQNLSLKQIDKRLPH